jgi:hypothetical protein
MPQVVITTCSHSVNSTLPDTNTAASSLEYVMMKRHLQALEKHATLNVVSFSFNFL